MLLDRVLGQHVVALADRATARQGRLGLKCSLTFVLLACLGGLSALAHASPPDPVWLPGIYDGADHDDEVALLTDTAAAGDSRPLSVEPSRLVLRFTLVGSTSARADASLLGFHLRAPPIT